MHNPVRQNLLPIRTIPQRRRDCRPAADSHIRLNIRDSARQRTVVQVLHRSAAEWCVPDAGSK
eukprot:29436-Eustigmatos_ZCMA.PRE.1